MERTLAVMPEKIDPMERAIKNIGWRRGIQIEDRFVLIACLLRHDDWRPLQADWWRGKDVCIIGADLDGNFFLRHCDGTVRLWDHKTQTDTIVAPSVKNFASRIVE